MTSYATSTELRIQIDKMGYTGTGVPENLQLLLDAATDSIDRFCNRPDGFVATSTVSARVYNGSGGPYQWIDECVAVTLVEVKDSPTDTVYVAWSASNWIAFTGDPNDPDFNRTPYQGLLIMPGQNHAYFISGQFTQMRGFQPDTTVTRGVPTVRVTAKWGYAVTVPPSIKEACIIQAARWYKRGESAWADALAPANFGTLLYKQELDPDLKMILSGGRFVKPVVGRR